MVWWCCSFAECHWHFHSAVVAGTGVPDSSYQLELEASRLHTLNMCVSVWIEPHNLQGGKGN